MGGPEWVLGGPEAGGNAAIAAAANAGNGVVNVFDYMTAEQARDVASNAGLIDVTAAIQSALDNAPFGSIVYVPAGTAKLVKVVGQSYCLKITRLVHLWSDALLRFDTTAADTAADLLRVSIDNAGAGVGVGDVRFHLIRAEQMLLSGGYGRSSIRYEPSLPMLRAIVCGGSLLHGVNGPAVFAGGDMQGTIVEKCTLNGGVEFGAVGGVYHADNIIVRDNTIFGSRSGVKFDMIYGAYSSLVANNTIVSDGNQIEIVNGSQIKIRDNQFEQPNANTGLVSAQVSILGTRYTAESIDISGNNFGGLTTVQYGIYAGDCNKLHIDDNDFNLNNSTADIVLDATCKNARIGRNNRYRGGSRGANGYADLGFSDGGTGNTGYRKFLSGLSFSNSWSSSNGFVTVHDGKATFGGTLTGGTLTAATTICTLPVGYRPYLAAKCPVVTSGGLGWLEVSAAGVVTVGSAPGATVNLDGMVFDVVGDQ